MSTVDRFPEAARACAREFSLCRETRAKPGRMLDGAAIGEDRDCGARRRVNTLFNVLDV